jgi:hypothetical protein
MNKRVIAIITLISSVLSLIFVILSHFGIIRYISIHSNMEKKYIEGYSKLIKADEKTRVVVTFTATPENINNLGPMILSILDQTVKVDNISMSIPYNYEGGVTGATGATGATGYTGPSQYNIPPWYKDAISIYRSEQDYGPGEKIIPSLLRESEKDTKIIYIEENKIYGKDLIERLVDESNKYPNEAIATQNNSAILICPQFFKADVIDPKKEYYNEDWIFDNIQCKIRSIKTGDTYKSYKIK